ncbi:MAG TPA: DMT family transporter [Patescibacteria group bacterium]|nr:DMT family transporter [Patescibacteria group bacterium]
MSTYKKAVIALIVANTIWGAGPPIFKWSLESISPTLLAFFRFVIPTLFLLLFIGKIQKIRIRDGLYFILLGLFNCSINIGLYFLGLTYAPSINQPIIASAGPLFVIIGSALFLKDKATKKVLLGNLIGLTGVLFIVLEPVLTTHHVSSVVGNLLFIFSTISAALGTLISKKLTKHYTPLTLTFWTFLIATISILPFVITQFTPSTIASLLSLQATIGIIFGGFASSLLAYFLFYWGLGVVKASETTIFTYIDPVAAVVIAAPLLHEYPNTPFITGAFLVFAGIYIAEERLHWHPLQKLFGRY